MKKSALFLLTLFYSFTLLLSSAVSTHAQTTEDTCNTLKVFNDPSACTQFSSLIDGFFQTKPNSPWYNQTPQEFSTKVLNPTNPTEMFGERYTYAQINWILNSLIAMLNPTAGAQSPADILKFLDLARKFITYDPNFSPTFADYAHLGPLGIMAGIISIPYTHPIASGIQETKKVAELFNPATPVLAQGIGYAKLGTGNIQTLWKATRNISYLMIIILLVASGFMIMFRTQVNPQTVVSVQMVIPKLISSLILITFSYAIAGFVIDGIYVAIVSMLGLLNLANPQIFTTGGFLQSIASLTNGNFNFVQTFLAIPITIAIILLIVVVGGAIAFAVAWPGGLALIPIASAVFGIFAWAIYVAARIVGQLLIAYLNLIILTISGPLQIMLDVLPNRKSSAALSWFKCLVGNASVFVTYALLAIVGRGLFNFGSDSLGLNNAVTSLKESFLLPGTNFNLDFTSGASVVWWLLLGMGYFTAVPGIVEGVKNSLCKSEDQSKFIESLVKDTVGQISGAGQKAGEGVSRALDEQFKASGGTGPRPGGWGGWRGPGGGPQP